MGQPALARDVAPAGRGDLARDGVRYLQPEIVLLFKARHLRDKDRADFAGALPLLEEPRRAWLRRALGRVHPGTSGSTRSAEGCT